MQYRKLLVRISRGEIRNIAFDDFCRLVERFGFVNVRTAGSHRIYSHPAVPELLNLQELNGQAKPYQIRQALRLIERYNLTLEGAS